jgi:signal transduction histidine kinase
MTEQPRTKVLIVDDLPDKLLVYEVILRDLDLELVMARSGEEALKEVLRNEFAVILLDVNMPGMDGFETANLIRGRKKSAHTPIIFVTAFNDEMWMAEGYSRGAVDFITTPVIPPILQAKVRVFVDLFRMTQQVREHAQQQIALTAERAQRTAAEEANRRLSFLVKAGAVITRSLERRLIAQNILRLLIPEQADAAALVLQTNDDESVAFGVCEAGVVKLSENQRVQDLPQEWRRKLDQMMSSQIHANGHTVAHTPEAHGAVIEDRFVAVPLRDRENVFGALLAKLNPGRTPFSPADLQLMESITSRSAIALTNAYLYEQLEHANQQKNRFLSMLAHELRNPLAPIQSAVDLMRLCRLDNEDVNSAREVIERQVSHLVRIVDDLLDVSRITLGKIRLEKTPLDARKVITSAVEISKPLIDDQGHRLELEVPADALLIEGDSARLTQVLSNLLNNAAKYTPPPGEIHLSLREEEGNAVFRIRDNGIGIPTVMLAKVFDLFTQVDGSTERAQGGLGVGLNLVRELVEMHGGRVEVTSAGAGQGSEFLVMIPLLADARRDPSLEMANS